MNRRSALQSTSVWWGLLLTFCAIRFVVKVRDASTLVEQVPAQLIPVAAAIALLPLLQRTANIVITYAATILVVYGSGVYGGIKDVFVRPQCDTSDQFDTWSGVADRWLDVVVAVLVFGLVAATRPVPGRVTCGLVPSVRWVWPAWLSAIVAGAFIYSVATVLSRLALYKVVEQPGAWTECTQATGSGITNAAVGVNLAAVSGFQEEIVWTGVGLLLLGAAARWQTAVAIAVSGAVLRALPHMYYTTSAEWYSVAVVTAWTMIWSGGSLLATYWVLRRWKLAGNIISVTILTCGVAAAHSMWNFLSQYGGLRTELLQTHTSAVANLPLIVWFVLAVVVFFSGLSIIAETASPANRKERDNDKRQDSEDQPRL